MSLLNESVFHSIFNQDSSPALLADIDAPNFTILAINQEEDRRGKNQGNTLLGKGLLSVSSRMNADLHEFARLQAAIYECLETGMTILLPVSSLDSEDGTPEGNWWQDELKPILDTEGKVRYLLRIRRNITEQTISRMQLESSGWQLNAYNAEKALNIKLEFELARMRAFAGSLNTRATGLNIRRNKDTLIALNLPDLVLSNQQLLDSEHHYHSILNTIPQIAWANNLRGKINFINERWYEYTGLGSDAPIDWKRHIHPDDLENALKHFSEIVSGITGGEFEFRYRRFDGQYRWFLSRMRLIKNDRSDTLFWIGTSTDIEELKWLQQQKDDFVNIASHELKTPLTSLKVSMQLISERKESLSPFMFLSLMQRATKSLDRVVNLVDDLLNAGRLNDGRLELDKRWFISGELISEYVLKLSLENKYTIRFAGEMDMAIYADLPRIDQVLINIINNAIKYAPDSAEILVRIEPVADGASISVTDHGPGIRPELIPHLFDRYYHVENRGFQNTGLGLGLYICSEIVEKHGGAIHVESKTGAGSTFKFILPFSQDVQMPVIAEEKIAEI